MTSNPALGAAVRPKAAFRIVTRDDFTVRPVAPRRMHLFRQPDGRELQCGGPGLCRECNLEAAA